MLTQSYDLELYKYSQIGASQQNKEQAIKPEWSINLGEQALKIQTYLRNQNTLDIIILTESMLFIVT